MKIRVKQKDIVSKENEREEEDSEGGEEDNDSNSETDKNSDRKDDESKDDEDKDEDKDEGETDEDKNSKVEKDPYALDMPSEPVEIISEEEYKKDDDEEDELQPPLPIVEDRKDKIILPIEYPVLTIEQLTKRLFDLERECNSMKKEIIALKSNRNEPYRNIVSEKIKIDEKRLVESFKKRSIDSDFALIKEYYLDDDPQPIRRKNIKTYEYYNRRWHQDTGSYIINTITDNLSNAYNQLNTSKYFDVEGTILNQAHLEKIDKDPKYRRELLNKITNVLFV